MRIKKMFNSDLKNSLKNLPTPAGRLEAEKKNFFFIVQIKQKEKAIINILIPVPNWTALQKEDIVTKVVSYVSSTQA